MEIKLTLTLLEKFRKLFGEHEVKSFSSGKETVTLITSHLIEHYILEGAL